MLKFQVVAEKTAKNFRGLLFLPHPVQHSHSVSIKCICIMQIIAGLPGEVVNDNQSRTSMILRWKPCNFNLWHLLSDSHHNSWLLILSHNMITYARQTLVVYDQNLRPYSQNMTILRQFHAILHTYANVLIHKTSYNNFTIKILHHFLGVLWHSKLYQYDSNIIQEEKLLCIDL